MGRLMHWVLKAKLAIASLVNPWRAVRELKEENARLADAMANPLLTGIQIGNGTMDVGMQGAGPELVAGMFMGMFEKYPDAKNYIEMSFSSPIGPILVTVMKPGGKTPHQLRLEAERELSKHVKPQSA